MSATESQTQELDTPPPDYQALYHALVAGIKDVELIENAERIVATAASLVEQHPQLSFEATLHSMLDTAHALAPAAAAVAASANQLTVKSIRLLLLSRRARTTYGTKRNPGLRYDRWRALVEKLLSTNEAQGVIAQAEADRTMYFVLLKEGMRLELPSRYERAPVRVHKLGDNYVILKSDAGGGQEYTLSDEEFDDAEYAVIVNQ
jgi:hypothetical protein